MLRKLAVSLAVAGVLGATQANALGLGQIRIKSALNEPLDAEIQLLQVRDLDPQQIQPQMADMNQFAIAGLDRSRLLSDVQFQVNVNPNGTGSIRLTSRQPVREPFLNLLVEVNWPNGRLVREYTLLLDPPVFEAAPVAGSAPPVTTAATRPAPPQPALPTRARPSGPVDNIRTRTDPQTQVFVETQDTLGQLARRHSPGGGTDLNQMMLALQRKNPQAFPSGNINFLKAGVVLNLPSLEEVRAISASEAAREVTRQMQSWRAGRSAPAASTPQADGSKKPVAPSESQAAAPPAPQAQLKILSPEDPNSGEQVQDEAGAAEAGQSQPVDPEKAELLQRNEELENQLAVTQESVDRIERENTELNDKLTAISQQLETLQRLLELKDQQMAALQNQLQQVQQAPPVSAEPSAPPPPPPAGLVDKLMSSPAYMAGIGAVIGGLLVGLLGLLRRRRDDSQPFNAEPEQPASASTAVGAAAAAAVAGGALAAADEEEPEVESGVADTRAEDASASVADADLDLDMDLDLDLPLDEAAAGAERGAVEAAEPTFEDDDFDLSLDGAFEEETLPDDQVAGIDEDADDEFDLSFESEFEQEPPSQPAEAEADESFDDSLDDILGDAEGDEEEAERSDLRSGMGQLEAFETLDDEPEDTLESLGLSSVIDASEVPKEPKEEEVDFSRSDSAQGVDDSEDDALDFRLNQTVDMIQPEEGEPEPETAPQSAVPPEAPGEEGLEEDGEGATVSTGAEEAPEAEPEAAAGTPEDIEVPAAEAGVSSDEPLELELEDDFYEDAEALDTGPDDSLESADAPDVDAILAEAGAQPASDEAQPENAPPAEPDATSKAEVGEDDGLSLHPELEALLASGGDASDDDDLTLEDDEAVSLSDDDADLDAMLAELGQDFPDEALDEEDDDTLISPVEEELTANIAHDLESSFDEDSDLDSELEALLGSVDDEIALDESEAEDEDLGLEFLDGTDEVETKLDLARAYIDMEDRDGAKDILAEILQEGSNQQQQEARKLMESLA
ncbi:FimV/HubP family polar landmark protein [Marinobacterium aestuariivivens]|uniref:FimV/HubP family polar landmark protein n=1 Tax=Marinobacterium aestuariivivens TaxID=1698799 RepID=A0ABW2A7S1_9GAMM